MPGFGEELGRLIPHMRRFAKALVRGHSGQVADDLVQETIVLAMRAEHMARGAHLRSWCFSTLTRVHRHWEQTSGAGGSYAEGSWPTSAAEALPPGAPLAFIPKDIARLDLLPLDNREVLLLTVLVGMSYPQVAETLHVTTDTVLNRLGTARGILARGHRTAASTPSTAGFGTQKSGRAAQYLHIVK